MKNLTVIRRFSKQNVKNFVLLSLIFLCGWYLSVTLSSSGLPKENRQAKKEAIVSRKISVSLRVIPNDVPEVPDKSADRKSSDSRKNNVRVMSYAQTSALSSQGKQLVGKNGQQMGSFPCIVANYRKHLGIHGYLKSMAALGGRFFVLNTTSTHIEAEIDFDNKRLVAKGSLAGLSPRSRLIDAEPVIADYLRMAKRKFGMGNYTVILLLPMEIDHYIIGAINNSIEALGKNIKEFSAFQGVYVRRNRDLDIGIYEGTLKTGAKQRLNVSIKLNS